MALRSFGSGELERWQELLLAAARDIRKAREHLHVSDLPNVELEANMAIRYMEYIRQWAMRAESKVQSRKREVSLTTARSKRPKHQL